MSWLERISVQESSDQGEQTLAKSMEPGLTGQYDWELREKAGIHTPPPPPECMGLEGEYDPCGLAKRVALALDHDPIIDDLKTLEIIQIGRAIALKGQVADASVLSRIVEVVSAVDGTDTVDVNRVTVA
ncbi:BON domain-containing protein [Oscillatoria sp. FACHB-1407]|uniref:BON domain-containing protein n=1 Tax=Oscillatoria sp. FACHB-1407 TaxID=2692847 RepID=UPI001686E863|nr:BON domain-containing protein [Oscillatoria sp. FACHB-1407]MBD2460919.1 BON domain-containing protein [Oscillatoria sp. FACHB-1407]